MFGPHSWGMRAIVAGALAVAGWGCAAATVESVAVDRVGGRYHVDMVTRLQVSAAAAFAVMTDFSALPQVNPNVILSQPLPGGRLRTIVELCVLFFCKQVEQVQTVTREPPYRLIMHVIPALSDLTYGRAEWGFQALGPGSCRLRFSAELEPAFWVPPLIGPWLIQNKLKAQARLTSAGIEAVARERGAEMNGNTR